MRRAVGIAAFAALCLVAGCSRSSGDAPSSGPRNSVSSSPTTTPPPTTSTPTSTAPSSPTVPADVPTTGPNLRSPDERPPIEPVLATQHTAAGAKAFAEFFVRTIDWGFATMSGAYIRHYSLPSCTDCATFADGMDKARASGHRYVGGRITTTGVTQSSKPTAPHAETSVLVRFNINAFEELTHDGEGVSADPAHTGEQFEVSLTWVSQSWRVVAWRSINEGCRPDRRGRDSPVNRGRRPRASAKRLRK